MEETAALVQMAAKLVLAMDPETAKDKLHAIVCGGDVYETILSDGTAPVAPKPRKKGGGRKRKAAAEPEIEERQS
jgi:hypothetical protein